MKVSFLVQSKLVRVVVAGAGRPLKAFLVQKHTLESIDVDFTIILAGPRDEEGCRSFITNQRFLTLPAEPQLAQAEQRH